MKRQIKMNLLTTLSLAFVGTAVAGAGLGASYASADATLMKPTGTNSVTLTQEIADSSLGSFKVQGASVRTQEPAGIRFLTTISNEDVAEIPQGAEFGTFIIPASLLGENELTEATANVLPAIAQVNTLNSEYVPAESVGYFITLAGDTLATEFPAEMYGTVFAARSFVKYTYTPAGASEAITDYAYTSETVYRSISYVASAELVSLENKGTPDTDSTSFMNKIIAATTTEMSLTLSSYDADVGDTITATVEGATDGVNAYQYVLSSNAENVVKVEEDGTLTAVGVGTATITAKIGVKEVSASVEAVEGSTINPLSNTAFMLADEQRSSGNVGGQAGTSTGTVVAYTTAGGYAKFSRLNFGKGSYHTVEVTYAADGSSGGGMEIWVDGPSAAEGGVKLGYGALYQTGGWGNYTTALISLDYAITGRHDVYFVYGPTFGGSAYCYNLDCFRFIEDIVFGTEDMMAYRASSSSSMREDGAAISGFGNEGDRIVLGHGIRPVQDETVTTENAGVAAHPGYTGVPYVGVGATAGISFTYLNVPAGKIYLAYDKYYATTAESDNHKISVYVGDNTTPTVMDLKESTGSDWSAGQFSVLYKDTGAVATETCNVKFRVDENVSNAHWGFMNVCKLFVSQSYTAEQLVVTYSNTADMQCSLYLNGAFAQKINLPNSEGQVASLSISVAIENASIELVMDEADLTANNNAKATIYSMTLKGLSNETPAKVSAMEKQDDGKADFETMNVIIATPVALQRPPHPTLLPKVIRFPIKSQILPSREAM